ncbi:hypothetical protein [Aestuariivirga sp.]|uniref:hypothetical protein n=1 Tax=Aestuariivirga sp. TaxID=2650926 RepID=UPI00391B357E
MPATASPFEFWITVAVLTASVCVVGLMSWLERRPRTSLTPRLIPTTPVLLVFAFVAILALVHLFNLYGVHTGRSIRP